MTTGENKAVAVEPARRGGVVTEAAVAVEGGTDFGTTEWQAKVAGTAGVHGINREAAGLRGGVL